MASLKQLTPGNWGRQVILDIEGKLVDFLLDTRTTFSVFSTPGQLSICSVVFKGVTGGPNSHIFLLAFWDAPGEIQLSLTLS